MLRTWKEITFLPCTFEKWNLRPNLSTRIADVFIIWRQIKIPESKFRGVIHLSIGKCIWRITDVKQNLILSTWECSYCVYTLYFWKKSLKPFNYSSYLDNHLLGRETKKGLLQKRWSNSNNNIRVFVENIIHEVHMANLSIDPLSLPNCITRLNLTERSITINLTFISAIDSIVAIFTILCGILFMITNYCTLLQTCFSVAYASVTFWLA